MATNAIEIEQTTTLALQEEGKLTKSLRRFDIVLFGLIGYVVAKPVRDQTATIELPTDLAGAVGELT